MRQGGGRGREKNRVTVDERRGRQEADVRQIRGRQKVDMRREALVVDKREDGGR
jgi:hypothetical protein